MGYLGRQRRQVRWDLAASTVADAVATVLRHEGRRPPFIPGRVRVFVNDDGRLRAGILSSRVHGRPVLRGSLEARDGGTVLDGIIRESPFQILTPVIVAVGAVVMGFIAVDHMFMGDALVAVIGVFCLVAGTWVAWTSLRSRTSEFDSDCEELLEGLGWLTSPGGKSSGRRE